MVKTGNPGDTVRTCPAQVRMCAMSIRVAAAQVRSPQDTARAVEVVRKTVTEAKKQGVQLLVFPEALLGGYQRGASFGAAVGDRTAAGRDEFVAYSNSAVEIPGPEIEELRTIAKESSMHLVVGLIERSGSTLYCGSVTIDDNGDLVGIRRKLMPTATERLVWGQGDGSTLKVTPTAVGRLATAICWENLMPALRLNYYAQNAEVWCAPTADARDVNIASMRHIAIEGRCFVVAANQYAQASDLSPAYANIYDDPEKIVCRGGSVIVNPFGDVLAGPLYDDEGLLVADIDLDDVKRGKYDFDAAGHYSRPDIFRLNVDMSERAAVSVSTNAIALDNRESVS
jgi:nitrilase